MWKEKSLGAISGIIILILILVAIFADALAPYDYLEMHLADRLTGSSARYLLGTDQMGRDLLSRLIHGARLSLTVGSGGDRSERRGRHLDRRHLRVFG